MNLHSLARMLMTALAFVLLSPQSAHAVAQWARRYNMPCSGCHSPFPRLNATGIAFKMNGYRFTPGEKAVVSSRTLMGWIGPTWSPSLSLKTGEDAAADGRQVRLHLGGPLGRNGAFLIQPITGGSGDFNMAQAMLTFGSAEHRFRLVGGRLYAWGNGGGFGGSDRVVTISTPRMLQNLRGVQVGGLGHGARLEYAHRSGTTLSLFASDMDATTTRAFTYGFSLSRRLDQASSSTVEFFWGRSLVPVAGQSGVQEDRLGVLFSKAILDKKGREGTNFLIGAMAGQGSRAVQNGASASLWAGFVEVDWSPHDALTWIVRQEWESRSSGGGVASGLSLGALTQITPSLRLDTELQLTRPGYTSPQFLARLRLVY